MTSLHIFLFSLTLLLIGCNAPEPKLADPPKENVEEEHWDKHQFFDDLEQTSLDSLRSIIKSADSIVAYNWNGREENAANVQHHVVDAYGMFDSSLGKKIILNDSQKQHLIHLLTDSSHYIQETTMCFIPHIAFVYFSNAEIVGQSNICFLCSEVKSIPKSTSALNSKGAEKLKRLCRTIGLEIIDHDSMQ